MRKSFYGSRKSSGFTLIELILVILITAVLGSFLIAYMGTAITRSYDPVIQTQNLATAEATMEKITANYKSHLSVGNNDSWAAFTATFPYQNTTYVLITGMNGANFDTVEATVSEGDHRLVSYFMR